MSRTGSSTRPPDNFPEKSDDWSLRSRSLRITSNYTNCLKSPHVARTFALGSTIGHSHGSSTKSNLRCWNPNNGDLRHGRAMSAPSVTIFTDPGSPPKHLDYRHAVILPLKPPHVAREVAPGSTIGPEDDPEYLPEINVF